MPDDLPPVSLADLPWREPIADLTDQPARLSAILSDLRRVNRSSADKIARAWKRVGWTVADRSPDPKLTKRFRKLIDDDPRGERANRWRTVLGELQTDPVGESVADLIACELLWRRGRKTADDLLTGAVETLLPRIERVLIATPPETPLDAELQWKVTHLFGSVLDLEDDPFGEDDALDAVTEELLAEDGCPVGTRWEDLFEAATATVRLDRWIANGTESDEEAEPSPFLIGLLEHAVAHLDREGHLAFDPHPNRDWLGLFAETARIVGWKKSHPIRHAILTTRETLRPRGKSYTIPDGISYDAEDPPGYQSDAAETACLRTNRLPGADHCSVRHGGSVAEIHLVGFGLPLLVGGWTLGVTAAGEPLPDGSEWGCVCWHTDDDGDYLELQQTIAGVRLERAIFLSRTDRFAIFADSVFVTESDDEPVPLTIETGLPLADGLTVRPDPRTGGVTVSDKHRLCSVIPLYSTEQSETEPDDCCVRFRTVGTRGRFLPILVDWDPLRQSVEVNARQLTVTETQDRVSPGTAEGYRIAFGDDHLLVYRSLVKSPYARAVLGHHTRNETVIGRFTDGTVKPLLLVEG